MMNKKTTAPYGSWKSPITSDLIVAGTIGLGQIVIDGADVCWIEGRPVEKGRNVIVRRTSNGNISEINPSPLNARTRVHEYGGGSFAFDKGAAYFTNFADQRIYRQDPGSEPRPITPEADLRYADLVIDAARGRIICVCEDHTIEGREAENRLVEVGLEGGEPRTIAGGHDFYSSPRISPDGSRLAWLTWDHPLMPWDGSQLWMAEIAADGSPGEPLLLAGGPEESIFQPEWSPSGILHFVSDRSGWWNLYRLNDGKIEPLCEMDAEFGQPQWVFGMSTFDFLDEARIVCTYIKDGFSHLAILDVSTGVLTNVESSYTIIDGLRVAHGRAYFYAGSATTQAAIVSMDIDSGQTDILRRSSEIELDPGYLSSPEAIEFPTEDGLTAHGFFYPPRNKDFQAPAGELPPLLVKIHGGPTSMATPGLKLGLQYWTSRGIAVLDVNYGGSTGFGRAYRERLKGNWGIVDVDDCVNGAKYLAETGRADPHRLAITGGSAGGYTTLCALVFRDLFKAGASHFGVSDLEALEIDTHKFESRYSHSLVGPYPERADLYHERSPIHFTHNLSAPVIFFQGLEDRIVPPNQAEMMVDALRAKRLPVAYLTFEGEQHGFRQAENIKRALDGEFYFYSSVFGFEPADQIEPVPIENLSE